MSEWTYIGLSYGLTWVVLAGYAVYLLQKRSRAREALEHARN